MNDSMSSLTALLDASGLLCYEQKMLTILKLREASDVVYLDEKDFNEIGMTRPEQKRLRAAYHRLYPRATIMGKLKKKLLGNSSEAKKIEVVHNDEDQHVIPLEKIVLNRELGKGEFGSVYHAVWTNSAGERIQVAAKCVSTSKLLANSSSFIQEAAIMHKMRNDFVVRLYGIVLDTKTVMLVSELAPCGSLLECLRNPGFKTTVFIDTLCDFSIQIASGMKYLASKRLIHRDLAARNVLVFSSNQVKIADFGLSRLLGVGEYYYRGDLTEGMKLPIAWCAPESINFLRFTSASDVWSFGVTLYELFSYGLTPWEGLTGTQILSAVDYPRNERLPCPDLCPADIYNLMQQCWSHKPEERPSFTEILNNLNDLSPQLLLTIAICNDGVVDHLQYSKSEVILVLDKQPSAYPDGYYWMGCMRDGRKGLFRPANTVARLGAENPCGNNFIIGNNLPNGILSEVDKEKEKDKDKEKDKKKKRKVIISEPQNDLRHTCHIGIDGVSFGAMPGADKFCNQAFLPDPLTPTPSVSSPFSHSQLDSAPPPQSPTPQSAQSGASFMQSVADNGRTSSCSTTVTALTEIDSTSDSVFTDQLLVGLPRTMPFSPPADLPYRSGELKNEKKSFNNDTGSITDRLNEMNLLATNFSFSGSSAMQDCQGDNRSLDLTKPQSLCRIMSEGELMRWEGRVDREHKKVSKLLSQERCKEMDLIRRSSLKTKQEKDEKITRSFSNSISSNSPLQLSEEAQNAYKLLVQCGNELKYGKVSLVKNNPRAKQAPENTSSETEHNNSSDTVVDHERSPLLLSKEVDIGTTAGESSKEALIIKEQSVTERLPPPRPAARVPPPVPPKPKKRPTKVQRDVYSGTQGGFASAVASSVLFSGVKNEEVLNF